MKKSYRGNKGLTLVEVIISMALLGLISISIISLFTTSAIIINRSESTLKDTYTGKDIMELMYSLSLNTYLENLESELLTRGFNKVSAGTFVYETDKQQIEMKYTDQGDLVKVVTKVYSKANGTDPEAKYEAHYRWTLRGEANGKQ